MRRPPVRASSVRPLTHCHADPCCPCDACVAADIAALTVAPPRALHDADRVALTLRHGPAIPAAELGFAPLGDEGPIDLPTLAALTRKAGAL